MKKKMRRLGSFLLAVFLVLSLLPTSALAEETADHTIVENDSAEMHAVYPMARADYVPGENSLLANGNCGDSLTWTLTTDGILTISGRGAMVDYIGKAANPPWYDYREHIKRVVIEEGITHVGDYAFSGIHTDCIILPDSLRSIGNYSFQASGATNVTFGSKPLMLGAFAFARNRFVKVRIPDNVTVVGQYCFSGCSNMETISIGSGVKELLRDTFYDCRALKNVILSEGLETVGFQVFNDCRALTTLTLPASVTYIDRGAFRDCDNLCTLIFSGDRPNFHNEIFSGAIVNRTAWYPCTNTTWRTEPHIGYGAYWMPNHICENGKCTLCGMPEIYKYGQQYNSTAVWTLDVNGTLTYYGDGLNPSASVGAGLPTTADENLVKKVIFTEEISYIQRRALNRNFEKTDTIIFLGDAPEMDEECFSNIKVTAYYPAGNPTWTEEVRQQYGGNITWVAACTAHSFANGVCTICGEKDPNFHPEGLLGDADGSGVVDYVDAMLVLQYHTGVIGSDGLAVAWCDVDKSGAVDYVDAMLILQYHTGVISKF